MSKEGIPAVYEVKGNDHIRHIDKTRQDHQPVAERQRVKDARNRRVDSKIAAELESIEFVDANDPERGVVAFLLGQEA